MTSVSIQDFLLARIAEDEAQAKKHLGDSRGFGDYMIRVLAESATKRAIIESYESICKASENGGAIENEQFFEGMGEGVRLALVALTIPYKDHQDHDPNWVLR